MRFGSSTMFLCEKPVTVALDVIARAGFAGAEIWMEHVWLSAESPASIRRRARSLGLALSVHAASYDLNIASANPGIRRESIRQMEESIQLAADLAAEAVAMHPGRLSHGRDNADRVWEPLLETVTALDELAARLGVRLGIETMEKRKREYFVYPDDLARLFPQSWEVTGLTVDLAHATTVMNPLAFLDAVSALPVVHAHCSDHSTGITHVPLGWGTLDVPTVLRALGRFYDGLVMIEGYVPGQGEQIIPANADYLRRHGFM